VARLWRDLAKMGFAKMKLIRDRQNLKQKSLSRSSGASEVRDDGEQQRVLHSIVFGVAIHQEIHVAHLHDRFGRKAILSSDEGTILVEARPNFRRGI
jgi:tRNA C32,U32 (ribose-2'-O)-methylase TrmJ